MEKNISDKINKNFGKTFQKYRQRNNLTQEQLAETLSKSTKTISQFETGKDGTSKRTDIELMNFLGIMPNTLYRDFITNSKLNKKISLSEEINNLSDEKLEALFKIIEIIKNL